MHNYNQSCIQLLQKDLGKFTSRMNFGEHKLVHSELFLDVACPKEKSLAKKTLQTASKSAYKWQRNSCSNYAPVERTALRTRSVTNKKNTPHFRTYSRRALYDLPQTLHVDRARRAHHKRCHPFFDPTYSFSYTEHGKIWPNLPTRGFSAITP